MSVLVSKGEKPTLNLDFARNSNKGVLSLGYLSKKNASSQFSSEQIERALNNNDVVFLRNASDFFYQTNGIYSRLVRYASSLLTFDHMIYPILPTGKKPAKNKVEKSFSEALQLIEGLNIKRAAREITHSVVRRGVYYGYVRENNNQLVLQDLPVDYCRVIQRINNVDVVEFDVNYFDAQFSNADFREQVLASFPKETQVGYKAMKNGKLAADPIDRKFWVPLELGRGVKFTLMGSEIPLFVQVLTEILNLEDMKELQKQKAVQELAKIVVQKMPIKSDGELVFELEETQVLHNNVVQMLRDTVGADVLTTFADVDLISVMDKNNDGSFDVVKGSRNSVFAEAGVSEQLFATDGNLALEKSITSDEAILFHLLNDIETWINGLLASKPINGVPFGITLPRTTVFSSAKAVEAYKQLAQVGYSKMLPGIIAGQSQRSILSTMTFENELLGLPERMTPLQMSSTQSGAPSAGSASKGGRPEKPDDEKSEKTIANISSAS